MRYQEETIQEIRKLTDGTIAARSAQLGAHNDEPLLVAMDAMLRYAKAYRRHFDSNVGDDGVLGPCFVDAIKGIRGLLNGDGAVAMEKDITTDSKDNGVIEALYWHCCEVAGLDGDKI
jgi:hypothetical protein